MIKARHPFFLFLTLLLIQLGSVQTKASQKDPDSFVSDSLEIMECITLTVKYNRINYDSALFYAEKAQTLSKKINAQRLLARSKLRVAAVHTITNRTELASAELDTVIDLSIQTGFRKMLMYAKVEKGRLSEKISQYDQAVSVLFEALEIAEDLKEKNTEARIKNYLASIYNFQMQYDLAVKYYKEALVIVTDLNFKPGISAIYTNLGETYLSLKQYDSAIQFQQKALKIKKELDDQLGIGRVFNNLGNSYIAISPSANLDSALAYYRRSWNIAEEINDAKLKAQALFGMTRVHFSRGDLRLAKRRGDELLKEISSLKDLPLASQSYGNLALIHAALNDPGKANMFKEKGDALADSLLLTERIKITQELEAKYQSANKQKVIDLLEAENSLNELTIVKRKNERNGLIALAIVVLIVLGLLVNQYRIKQAANKQLQELDRLKSIFFENLSHEFRTPLSLILAPLQDRINKPISKEDRLLLEMVLRNAENLDELIKQLLELAKLEKGKYEASFETVEASHYFKVIASSFESLAAVKNVDFEVQIPDDEEWLQLDKDLVKKVCNNLLSNAFKFTSAEGNVSFKIRYDGMLIIQVADDGQGIGEEEQKLIFERFYKTEKENVSGTGIGLALTKELVEVIGGNIVVQSKRDQGSTFEVSIPLKKATPLEGVKKEPPREEVIEVEEEDSTSSDKPNLLIIEDNKDLRIFLATLFSVHYNVQVQSNGKLGVDAAIETIPDLIVSDIMMEEMDGLELCEQLKSNEKTDHIPIILLTARSDQQTRLKGLKFGADAYLLKPFESEELKITAEKLIEQRKKLREKYAHSLADGEKIPEQQHPFIEKCLSTVQKHLSNEALTSDEFARELGMSRMQVHRKLKAMTGFSTTSFIRHSRLIEAKSLLEKGEPVSQVAYSVGFSSLAYFTKTFKAEFGEVPSQIAKKPAKVT